MIEAESDSDDDVESNDVHDRARILAAEVLRREIGKVVSKTKDGTTATGTVSTSTLASSSPPPPKPSAGLVDGLPLKQGEPDLLALWLKLYPGDMSKHIAAMNAVGLRSNSKFQLISEHEYVRFWGMATASRQFAASGKNPVPHNMLFPLAAPLPSTPISPNFPHWYL